MAGPLPPSLHVDGLTPADGDLDWYAIGALPAGGDLRVRTQGPVDSVRRVRWRHRDYVAPSDEDGTDLGSAGAALRRAPVAAHLRRRALRRRPRPRRHRPGGRRPPTRTCPGDLTWPWTRPSVAAYWAAGQR